VEATLEGEASWTSWLEYSAPGTVRLDLSILKENL
jgi:hypothetical protein